MEQSILIDACLIGGLRERGGHFSAVRAVILAGELSDRTSIGSLRFARPLEGGVQVFREGSIRVALLTLSRPNLTLIASTA